MRQRKAQVKKPLRSKDNLQESLESYDAKTLYAVLNSFEGSLAWEVFKSFIYYNAAVHGTMSNDLIQQTGKTMEACASGAKAEVLREVVDKFIDTLKAKISGDEGVVQPLPPEEQ